jgi:TPR repeat protein
MGMILNLIGLAKNAQQAVGSWQKAKDNTAHLRGALNQYQGQQAQKECDRATAGDSQAQFELGERFFQGLGVDQNYAHAAGWFQAAAIQGHTRAQCNLAMMCFLGRGVSPDPAEAYKWACLAALRGSEDALAIKRKMESRISPEAIAEGEKRAMERPTPIP